METLAATFSLPLRSFRLEVDLTIDRGTVNALPDFDEPATYHLTSVGWLRKHVGWKADSESDEEPG